ncbi:cytochrome P450 [Nocardia sp. NPDC049190]|uniref:cytochrome P450 n=1 Tax=Nocardia sp. NPDC049190 TaxID=3155650 RepID=UPI0033E5CE06
MADIGVNARKAARGGPEIGCPVERGQDGVWRVRGYAAGLAMLRSAGTRQAGLGIETIEKLPARIRRPVLYRDGPEHREHRRQTARYFTPRRVDEHYREVMVRVAETQLAELRRAGRKQLTELSFPLAIEVVSAVIGLTDSRPGIQRRLDRFFPEKFGKPGLTSVSGVYWTIRQTSAWLRLYFGDVRPAVRARRRERQDDLISHLLDEGCTDGEILGECLTFAAAGMITAREFVNVAAWHLFTDSMLLERYRTAAESDRLAILREMLRLEPVIGNLLRRTTTAVEVPTADGGTVTVPPGELVDIVLSAANLDPRAMGAHPSTVCPGRLLAEGATDVGLSFGAGPHKCPGVHIAMLETDIFLSRLFALDGVRMVAPPRVSFNEEINSYELRGLEVALPQPDAI